MRTSHKKILNTLLIIDIGVLIFCMLSGNRDWLYSTQIGIVTSALVIAASMMSYRKMIDTRLEHGVDVDYDDRDKLDEIDDPYDLYEDDRSKNTDEKTEELSKEEFVEIYKEEKSIQKAQKRSIAEVFRDSKAFMSIYRIGAYGLLVLGFFYLTRHEYLDVPAYFFALSVPPVIVVIMMMRENKIVTKEE